MSHNDKQNILNFLHIPDNSILRFFHIRYHTISKNQKHVILLVTALVACHICDQFDDRAEVRRAVQMSCGKKPLVGLIHTHNSVTIGILRLIQVEIVVDAIADLRTKSIRRHEFV